MWMSEVLWCGRSLRMQYPTESAAFHCVKIVRECSDMILIGTGFCHRVRGHLKPD